ncbi:hypothetical protein ED312_07740 [Sinomicrobium pectinilyticum]|uniref:Peptidase M48 domain-containing protein n=1 Tax=Sinomicrobium pectinilyticum TaxID=1084421 RepID=A0A3N0EL89_SINP1|nr:M48 family metallopeptidase [Sinomicrobium pectinilyticum]RNL88673.1 hypothetical protein ED312_07740 [Sinomicrobium pectinilyticum]
MKEIKPSENFKNQARKAIWSILLFVFTYSVLAVLAIGLTVLCAYAGIQLIIAMPKLVTIALGIGLASLGFLILVFLFKFLFKSGKTDLSHMKEITKEDEPELFGLVEEIVAEVGTDFPKKVFISGEINASVFYNSNFWSMFLPVRKNLHIGMGLVNTVTVHELKAILAHEFGHFSQKSMKVGSYVYNVNQVIYNMLYDNESFDKLVSNWAAASGYFSIFVIIAVKIVQGIQWILRKLYNVVNISYMALSREMEFHADEIAGNVTGYVPMQHSLLRLNLADYAWNAVVQFYQDNLDRKIKSPNIFKEQLFVMNFLAGEDGIPVENGFPRVSVEDQNRFNKSRLVIKDQWASHPSAEDRIENLKSLGIAELNGNILTSGANGLFKNAEQVQEMLTEKIFADVPDDKELTAFPLQDFKTEFVKKYEQGVFDKVYNSYYDNKNPEKITQEEMAEVRDEHNELKLSELFSKDKVDRVYTSIALQNDINTLSAIGKKEIRIKSFDYDGKRYRWKEGKALAGHLEKELEAIKEKIRENDRDIFHYFKKLESESGREERLEVLYNELYRLDEDYDRKFNLYMKLSEGTQFISFTTPFEEIKRNFQELEDTEKAFKEAIRPLLSRENISKEITGDMRENFERYLSGKPEYFRNNAYQEDNLTVLFTALGDFYYLISSEFFLQKKELLDYQAALLRALPPKVKAAEQALSAGNIAETGVGE